MNREEINQEILDRLKRITIEINEISDFLEGIKEMKCELCEQDKMAIDFNVSFKTGWCNECYKTQGVKINNNKIE